MLARVLASRFFSNVANDKNGRAWRRETRETGVRRGVSAASEHQWFAFSDDPTDELSGIARTESAEQVAFASPPWRGR